MTKKQTYTTPAMVSLDLSPTESVLNFTSDVNDVLTIQAIIGTENNYEGVDW